MIKWFKEQSSTVKGMIILIIILLIGIIVRWETVSTQATGSFRELFVPAKDSTRL